MVNFASRAEYRSRIETVVVYINEHLSESLDVSTLAEVSTFSPIHFPRIFQAAMNETPQAYINRLRVERAAKNLMNSKDLPVTDVATACGFSSPSDLDQAFKSHYGVSTSGYAQGRHLQSLADACSVQASTMASGEELVWEARIRDIDGQTWAVFNLECREDEIETQYLSIFRDWLPDSGYEPADIPANEIFSLKQQGNASGLSKLEFYLPVKPL